ncbi:unnamed protein product [Cladocopium goreaui]|uniref:Uncharacterized protein n=1 Tax=Cladocopium goreaui TaxID=2562237 RepID=A0A9P1BRY2_9DINO|nr:unnamed protein product [Cladocopium goreaui]
MADDSGEDISGTEAQAVPVPVHSSRPASPPDATSVTAAETAELPAEVPAPDGDAGIATADGEGLALETQERRKAPEGLVWVVMHNSKALGRFQHVKVLVPKELTLTELRHFLCGKVGCPFKELHIEIEGKPMWAGREMPLIEVEDRDYRIRWCATTDGKKHTTGISWWRRGRRVNRVAKLMQSKQIGGINAVSWEQGRTVLHFIALNGDTDLFREAVSDPKADEDLINVRDKLGDTALTIAAITGYVDILATCLEKEADVEAKNLKGRTALLLAAEHGHSDAVQMLLVANAELDPGKGTTCPSAMYLAELNQRDGVVKTIVQHLQDMAGDDEF